MIVIDTSVIYALLDGRDANHERAATWYEAHHPALVTTPLILAEVDHLAGARAGARAQQAWRQDLAKGVYDVRWWSSAPQEIAAIANRYADIGVGLADASLVALAGRIETANIATFDDRHFRAMRPVAGGAAFRLLPNDAA